jgi:hypothetical protein
MLKIAAFKGTTKRVPKLHVQVVKWSSLQGLQQQYKALGTCHSSGPIITDESKGEFFRGSRGGLSPSFLVICRVMPARLSTQATNKRQGDKVIAVKNVLPPKWEKWAQ